MEKKNTILLTVIAVATLLVAVVGATFAYFTASVTTNNNENNTTTVKTQTLASAVMDMGSNVSPQGTVYPGYKALKTVTVKGSGAPDAESVTGTLTLTPSVTDFGNHIKYSLYKVSTANVATNGVTCTESNPQAVVDGSITKYSDAMTCDVTNAGTAVKEGTFTGTTPVTTDIIITPNTDDTYYLVIEYMNDENADQNSEQGKTFSVALSFVPKA